MQLPEPPVLFREVQPLRANRIGALGVLVCIGVVGVLVPVLFGEIGAGRDRCPTDPLLLGVVALVLLACAGTTWLLLFGRLVTEVRSDGLRVQFWPLTKRHHFAWSEIESAEARSYRPLVEYGGWGVRWGGGGKAYNVSGNRGVQLVLWGGKRLLIGSQRSDALAQAIRSAGGPGAPRT